MPQKNLLSIGIIAAVLFLIGGSFGYMIGKGVPQASILETSKVIQARYATARGEVAEISGRTITLTKDGESLSVLLKESAKFTTFFASTVKQGEAPKYETKDITLEDVKVGDDVAVQLQLNSDDTFEGMSLTVIP